MSLKTYLNPDKSFADWFFTVMLEQYECLEVDEMREWMRRFQYQPDKSKPDLWIWIDEDTKWLNETMKLCREITDDLDIFGKSMPDCFKNALFHFLEQEIDEHIDWWIEELKTYAATCQDEEIMNKTEWENSLPADPDELCCDKNCASGECRAKRERITKKLA